MKLTGRVLWWSDRDQNGVIVDPSGNEFYFDRSVLRHTKSKIIRNSIVLFEFNSNVKDCLCATRVEVASAKKRKSLESEFRRQDQAAV